MHDGHSRPSEVGGADVIPDISDGEPQPATPAEGWAVLLAREPWHWFATLTFSPEKTITDKYTREQRRVARFHPIRGMHLEAADKAFRWWLFELNKSIYGKNWRRIPHGGVVWARGQEFHKSGRVHFHAVLAAPDVDLNRAASRYRFHELWYREFGRNQLERPRDQDDVLGYLSKYVSKDGEVDLSPNFGTARPPQIFDLAAQRKASNPLQKLAAVDDKGLTQGREIEAERSEALSLTLPVRPQLSQTIFTDETFFNLAEETQNESDC